MVLCWWCCHETDQEPLHMPVKHDERRNTFNMSGNFCSWSCMKSFALDKYGVSRGGIICGNIITYRKLKYNIFERIMPAPNKFKLQCFGGDLTIEEFRKNRNIERNIQQIKINECPYKDMVIKDKTLIENNKLEQINKSTGRNDSLKLKRNKPLKRSVNNLETALGIFTS